MSTNLSTVQALAKACLAANAAYAGVRIFVELDETATPDQLAAFEDQFERELLGRGVAVIVCSPELDMLDKAEGSAVHVDLAVAIAICEIPEVNRGAPDAAASPPRTPAGKSCTKLLEQAIVSLLPQFRFPAQPAGRPVWADGFWAYYLVATKKHLIRAASPAA